MARLDPHSYADDTQPQTRHFSWHAAVDFDARIIRARVTLDFVAALPAASALDLDTRALTIHAVTDRAGAPLPFTLHAPDPVLGARLSITLPAQVSQVTITYETSPDASALQWLTPAQTHGKRHPYLFSQCQAIHARSVVPCQDTASIRQTYDASIDVPHALRAVMGAAPVRREITDGNGDTVPARAVEHFAMPQPIPPYLFAFAVGDLDSRELSPRARVWGEPGVVDAAAAEFVAVDAMLQAAEALFGAYDWERFDLLVMPPSFPYGGMENPRLTFLTPALVSGDRTQVNVVAHELAHSWTGNLVTNATAEHFWLNEGFTVFAERRILAALDGEELALLHAAVGLTALEQAIAQRAAHPELTRLRTHLEGIDPDEAFSIIPYEKGFLLLKTIEEAIGRARFDRFLGAWLGRHRFGAVTTGDFVALMNELEPGVLDTIGAAEWLDGVGLPSSGWRPRSARLAAVEALVGTVPSSDAMRDFGATEWQLFLDKTPRPAPIAHCRALDERYHLSDSTNPEVLVSWLTLAAESGDASVLPKLAEMVGRFGRMKYLRPLYGALLSRPDTRALAHELFAQHKAGYHPIAVQVITGLLTASASAQESV